MNPNKVYEIVNTLIDELNLPMHVSVSHNGPVLIFGPGSYSTRSRVKNLLNFWSNKHNCSWVISVGLPMQKRDDATKCLALDTHRTTEVWDILESLIAEQALPLTVVDRGFRLEILTDEGIDYRSENMITLETYLEEEGLDIPVRHSGFSLRQKEDRPEVMLSVVNTLANHLASLLVRHGLHVYLLHDGFRLIKSQEDAIEIAEVKELTYRLGVMVGIRYIQGDYGDKVPGLDTKIHWTHADINTALP